MLKPLALALLATFAFAADAPKEVKSPATILYEKAVADNSKECDKAYEAYQKALEVAIAKIIKVLEAAKKDLNDPSKGKLTITERAKAIAEVEEKIAELKKGALKEVVASRNEKSDDLLGDEKVDMKKLIVGEWKIPTFRESVVFKKDNTFTSNYPWGGGKWELKDSKLVIVWSNNIIENWKFTNEKMTDHINREYVRVN